MSYETTELREAARSIQGNLGRCLYRRKDVDEMQKVSDLLFEAADTIESIGNGTLTAEQVREAVEKQWHDLPDEYDMPEAAALPEYSYDWQAIADELNATLGSTTYDPKWTLQGETQTQEFWRCECGNCGYEFGIEDRSSFPFKVTIDKVDVPNFCPECGAKQKKAVER